MVAQRALGILHIGRMRCRVDVEHELRRGFVDHAVMDIFKCPAPPPGAEGMRPQRIEPLHWYML